MVFGATKLRLNVFNEIYIIIIYNKICELLIIDDLIIMIFGGKV